MAHTNHTTNYELPQFVASDKPTWLGDVNGAMSAIDTAIAGVAVTASGADSKADSAISTANTAAGTASDAATLANTANTNANSALTTAGNAATAASAAQSAASAVDTKVGALTDLTTTDKTSVVAAINEVKGEDGTLATNMGALTDLTTTDKTSVVAAINEVNAKPSGASAAADVTYDNTTSGLTASNVQAAIDELAQSSPAVGEYIEVTGDGTKTVEQLLNELFALIDFNKISDNTRLVQISSTAIRRYDMAVHSLNTYVIFTNVLLGNSNQIVVNSFGVYQTGSAAIQKAEDASAVDMSNNPLANGEKLRLYY